MKNKERDTVLKSVLNFRDAGDLPNNSGCRLRKGLVYRSAEIDRISRKDIEKLHLPGIRTIIDLRAPGEYNKRKVTIPGINMLSLPLDFEQITRERLKPLILAKNRGEEIRKVIGGLYMEILDASKQALKEVAKTILSDGKSPVLIHCKAGKDRTGILCALLHMIAGSTREAVIEDYMKSNEAYLPSIRRKLMLRKVLYLGFFPAEAVMQAIVQRQENIELVMDRIDEHYGGIRSYLAESGFDMQEYEALKKKLTEVQQ